MDDNENMAKSIGMNIGTTAGVKDGSKVNVSGVSKAITSNGSPCKMIRELNHGGINHRHMPGVLIRFPMDD